MFYLNRVILAGRLQDAPEIRYTPQGKPVIFFTLTLPSERLGDDAVHFENIAIRVMLVDEKSERWAQEKGKAGENILIEGGLVQRRWETAEGKMSREIEIVAHDIKALR